MSSPDAVFRAPYMALCAVDWGVPGADEAALVDVLRRVPRPNLAGVTPDALRAASFLVRHFRDSAAADWLEGVSRELVVQSFGTLGPAWDVALMGSAVAVAPISVEASLALIDCSADREVREATRAACVARMENASALSPEVFFKFFPGPHARSLGAARAWRAATAAHRGELDATGMAARSSEVHNWLAQSDVGPCDTVAARAVLAVADPDLEDFLTGARYLWEHSEDDDALRGAVVEALMHGAGVLTVHAAPSQELARGLAHSAVSQHSDRAEYGTPAPHVGLMAARAGLTADAEQFLPQAVASLDRGTAPTAQAAAMQLHLALARQDELNLVLRRQTSERLLHMLGHSAREGYNHGDVELLEFCVEAALPVLTDSADHRAWVRVVLDGVWNVDWDPDCHLRSFWGEVRHVRG